MMLNLEVLSLMQVNPRHAIHVGLTQKIGVMFPHLGKLQLAPG
jgi:hypothetical protein